MWDLPFETEPTHCVSTAGILQDPPSTDSYQHGCTGPFHLQPLRSKGIDIMIISIIIIYIYNAPRKAGAASNERDRRNGLDTTCGMMIA